MKPPKTTKKERIKKLEEQIQDIEELMSDADGLYLDLKDAQKEYKKLTGHEYEY